MDHPEMSAQVFPSRSKSISSAHIIPELLQFQLRLLDLTLSDHTTQCPVHCSPCHLELFPITLSTCLSKWQHHSAVGTPSITVLFFPAIVSHFRHSQHHSHKPWQHAWPYTALRVMQSFICLCFIHHFLHMQVAADNLAFSREQLLLHQWCCIKPQPGWVPACSPVQQIAYRTGIASLQPTELQIIGISSNMHSLQTA